MRWLWTVFTVGVVGAIVVSPRFAGAQDYTVYSVYKALDLGNPGETPQKDFYVNMGQAQGIREGTVLEVSRKAYTYDLISEKLYKEITFPIAKLRVIHVEPNVAVARLDKMLPSDKTPAATPRAVMIGDVVKVSE
jgi:hypothetical protein